MSEPHINVTPLIDVLLVLLIIFMVITPMQPSAFEARIPSEPTRDPRVGVDPNTLVVTVDQERSLRVNNEDLGATIDEPARLIERLSGIFARREQEHAYRERKEGETTPQIERTVFIKAPRVLPYGSVAKVVDAIKGAGARPISLQIDDLD